MCEFIFHHTLKLEYCTVHHWHKNTRDKTLTFPAFVDNTVLDRKVN